MQDAKDFVEVMNDLIKKIESVFAEANFGDTYTIDYSNFIYNLNACRTNIQSLYEKAYAEAESSIRFNDPNDSVENHLNEVSLTETDSSYIYLPAVSPLSCHRVDDTESNADRISYRHRCILPMAYYEPLTINSIPPYSESEYAVNFRPANYLLENSYMQNSTLIDTLANLIAAMTSDSLAQIEVVQLVGYTAPNEIQQRLGMKRAGSLRDKLKYYCNLPDSVFEVLDGGRNWELIYESMSGSNIAGGDSMVTILRAEKSPARRETLISGNLSNDMLRKLGESALDNHRQACCARIYYRNNPDTITPKLNRIVNELATNETPDYAAMLDELQQYSDDARALNLMGVIEYRRHKRGAAKKAFTEAALMGDEQAMTNLMIISR